MRAVIIAGTHSGCGKTTVALGLIAAFKAAGLKVQSFKCGPDFIDGGLHKLITGVPSRNLDIWMCGEDYVRECFYKHSRNSDLAVIEGVMGMYDGKYNTAEVAKLLNLPVVLVVDAYGLAESAGALVKGYRDWGFSKGVNVKWVILNRVGSERHYLRLKNAIKDVDVIGYLPRSLNFEIPHRHLGLMVAEENPLTQDDLNKLIYAVKRHIDINAIIASEETPICNLKTISDEKSFEMADCQPQFRRIGVAYDKPFCFYYEDNLEMLKNACAEIVQFSPLADSSLPDRIEAIYLGGGYPELYAEKLSKNKSMLKAIRDWCEGGMPLYAECGGLMYLSQGIYDTNNDFFEMCGVFPFETSVKLNRRAFLGYREITLKKDCLLGYKGDILRGHEFHYSEIRDKGKISDTLRAYSVWDNRNEQLEDEGYLYKNTLASYVHLHFGSNPLTANNFVNFMRRI